MTHQTRQTTRGSKAGKNGGKFVLGRSRFERISAVEGIELSRAMKERAKEFDRLGLTAEQRRRAIISAHNKG